MSTEVIKTILKKCDACGKQVKEFATVSVTTPVAVKTFAAQTYYGPEVHYDFCPVCNDKIIDFLKALKKG